MQSFGIYKKQAMNTLKKDKRTGIIVLETSASWEDVANYLKWLSKSKYAYHIDDDPEEIIGWSDDIKKIMRHNSDIIWNHPSKKDPWDVYCIALS